MGDSCVLLSNVIVHLRTYTTIDVTQMMAQQKLKHVGTLTVWIITREAMYERKVKARSCKNCCHWKAINIAYSQCVFVSSIQCVCANCYLWPVWLHKPFPRFLTNGMIWERKKNKFSLRLYCWRCWIHLQQQRYTLFVLFCHICCFVVVITFS